MAIDPAPQRGISASREVRNERPVRRKPIASRRFVFPWALGPMRTLSRGEGLKERVE
jgi:hypothetical protein